MAEATLLICEDALEAELVCNILRAEGIPCLARQVDTLPFGAGMGNVPGVGMARGRHAVVVPEQALEQARELLASIEPLDAD